MITSGLSRGGRLLITTFGLGLLRPAPGTWGSIPPVVLAGVMMLLVRAGYGEGVVTIDGWDVPAWIAYHAVLVVVLVVFSGACLVYGSAAEAHFNKKDPGSVCADETAGVCVALMLLPWSAVDSVWRGMVALLVAFLAFRVFDIVKLPPARGLQRHPGGVGILLDDLVAGVQAMIVVQAVVRIVM
ncbi:MAG: phosphatidylglycerophosphatase A [Phycisphaerales bacterium]